MMGGLKLEAFVLDFGLGNSLMGLIQITTVQYSLTFP